MTENNGHYHNLMQQLIEIVREAGDAVMGVYQREFSIAEKADKSPVTEADLLANQIICEAISNISTLPILSEESSEGFDPLTATKFWCIDPVDGTKEFIKKNGEFTINIALIEHGLPVLGVVYAPALDWLYYAAEGYGAYKQEGEQNPVSLAEKKRQPDDTVRVVGSRSHFSDETKAWLDERFSQYELVPMGSSLKICLVAEGRADVYPRFGPTSWWDTAAAHAIVLESGGKFTDIQKMKLHYVYSGSFLNDYFIVER